MRHPRGIHKAHAQCRALTCTARTQTDVHATTGSKTASNARHAKEVALRGREVEVAVQLRISLKVDLYDECVGPI